MYTKSHQGVVKNTVLLEFTNGYSITLEKDVEMAMFLAMPEEKRDTTAPADQQPAAELERFKVGERVEADWERRSVDREPSDPSDWRPATVTDGRGGAGYCDVVFDCQPGFPYDMRYSEVRRPAPVAPRPFVFGERVRVGIDKYGKDMSDWKKCLFVNEANGLYRVLCAYEVSVFPPDQVFHID